VGTTSARRNSTLAGGAMQRQELSEVSFSHCAWVWLHKQNLADPLVDDP
jgi:hypothetical protein